MLCATVACSPIYAVRGVGDEHVGFEPVAVFGEAVAVVEGYVVVLVVEGHAFFPSMMSSRYRGRIVSPRLSASRRTRRRLWRMIAGRSSMTRPSNVKD